MIPSLLANLPMISTSKAVTSVLVAMLADRKRISYETRLAEVWPEFGQHGKDQITLSQLMRHEAGCVVLCPPLPIADLQTERIKQGAASDVLASMIPKWPKGPGSRQYHPETRGLLVNEVIRRVDNGSRTAREFLEEEVATPLGSALLSQNMHGTPYSC